MTASGYQVYTINPRQVAPFKERYASSGAKSDKGDAHALADMVRIDRDQLRPVAGDSDQAQAVKVVARAVFAGQFWPHSAELFWPHF
ncbi:IS110 family transposase [Streptomyces sp. NPDC003393]